MTGRAAASPPESENEERGSGTSESRSPRPDRAGLLIAGAALAACAGLVLYGVLDSSQDDDAPERRVPTAAVTYEVTGTGIADITYQARSESGTAVTVKAAALPWRKTVAVPLGREPIVSIVLGENGSQARCTLTIRGQYVQSGTASGAFGRTTCTGSLPRPGTAERRT
ncbi:hypothetical protein AB0I00_08220 [Streptomyces sp. NPDC050803]|uniref:hypothetical protein n=1 Tax=unclassified Streptomyces TaxID=2593676 RepID=UPI0034337068